MAFITLDFETYYDNQYSLKKLTYEPYIRHELFKVHGFSYKWNDQPVQWVPGNLAERTLNELFPTGNEHTLIAHNTNFDGAILSWYYQLAANTYYCTQAMSRALWNQSEHSLEALATRCFPEDETKRKGTELSSVKGVWDLSEEQDRILGGYANNDVELTFECFKYMWPFIPEDEFETLDMTLKMGIHPAFILNSQRVKNHLETINTHKAELIANSGTVKSNLNSGPKFAAFLEKEHGIIVKPVPSPTLKNPQNTKYPFAKDALEFLKLQAEHPELKHLWEARIASTSTIEESRAKRLLDHAQISPINPEGHIAAFLNYRAAHTGRWSGTNKVNFQNFKRGSELRKSLCAPENYQVIVADLSNIELRVLAWFAEQIELLESFRHNVDNYSKFASKIYGRTVNRKKTAIDPDTGEEIYPDFIEGHVGKTCLGADTKILTNHGIKRIVEVTLNDLLWDGTEWVTHSGLLYQGESTVMELAGVQITSDHKILCGSHWKGAKFLAQDESILYQALATASVNLPLQDTLEARAEESNSFWSFANAAAPNTVSIHPMSANLLQLDATTALKRLPVRNATGNMPNICRTIPTAPDYLTGFPRLSHDVITQQIINMCIMANEVSAFTPLGDKTGFCSSSIFKQWKAGITQTLRWIESMWIKGIDRVISALLPAQRMPRINVTSRNLKNVFDNLKRKTPVYDLCNAGPLHRFTIITKQGPLIVHNCVLGLGYNMGAPTLQTTLAKGALGGPQVFLDTETSLRAVRLFRTENYKITQLWRVAQSWIFHMACPYAEPIEYKCIRIEPGRIRLPNGFYLNYPKLRQIEHPDAHLEFEYWNGKFFTKIYGGKLVENIVQALAQIILSFHMRTINRQLASYKDKSRVVLTVHDEIIALAKTKNAPAAFQMMLDVMRTCPDWCDDGTLVLDAEGGFDDNYSK